MPSQLISVTNQQATSLEQLQKLGRFGQDVKIAIIDGKIDTGHPLLASADISQADDGAAPTTHHGTAVASQIVGDNLGAAPAATIVSLPVFTETQGVLEGCSELALSKKIEQAHGLDCDLVNVSGSSMSPGGNGTQDMRAAVRACREGNTLIVCAVGNDGTKTETVPASMESVLAVGAHDEHGQPAAFNNYGPRLLRKTVLAPGVNVAAALTGDRWANISGTSFATPLVTGIAALVLRAMKDVSDDVNVTDVHDLLLQSISPCSESCGGKDGHDFRGLLNIDAVLQNLIAKFPVLAAQLLTSQKRPIDMETNDETPTVVPSTAEQDVASTPDAGLGDVTAPVAPAEAIESAASDITPANLDLPNISEAGSKINVHAKPEPAPAPVKPQALKGAVPIMAAEKAFVIGQIGYDFGTEARLDYFTQQMGGRGSHPYDPVEVSEHLFVDQNVDQASALTWTLKIDGIPVYAIEPENQFAAFEFGRLVTFLHDQETQGVERAAIAGTVTGETRLFNGQIVPTISPVLRGMYNWKSDVLAKAVIESATDDAEADTDATQRQGAIEGFLNRVYYELRNRGHSSSERALNYAATNAYQMNEVFDDAFQENLFLNQITAEESPICRPNSDCWDVILEFFNPKERLTASRKLYRYTIDVSDVVPVTVGELRTWHAY